MMAAPKRRKHPHGLFMHTGTCELCYKLKNNKMKTPLPCTRAPDTCTFFYFCNKKDESVKVRAKPQRCHDVSPTMEVWSNAAAAPLENALVCDGLQR